MILHGMGLLHQRYGNLRKSFIHLFGLYEIILLLFFVSIYLILIL
jgi:hypothetical protein